MLVEAVERAFRRQCGVAVEQDVPDIFLEMVGQEMEEMGWYSRSVVLVFDDGNLLFFSQDDEGNDAGSGYSTYEDLPILPTFR